MLTLDARAIVSAVLDALEHDAELRARAATLLRGMLAEAVPSPEPTPIYMRVAPFARRIGVCERTAWKLVRKGLPTSGTGRLRRVDVAAADLWMKQRGDGQVGRANVEERARRDARRGKR